jgi:hypothetical protein
MFEVRTIREASPYVERPYRELPNYQPIDNSLPKGMAHTKQRLRELAKSLDGLVWRIRDDSGGVRLAIFNAYWQSFVTLGCEELFAYIGRLWLIDPVESNRALTCDLDGVSAMSEAISLYCLSFFVTDTAIKFEPGSW